jgi:hypothetical protein
VTTARTSVLMRKLQRAALLPDGAGLTDGRLLGFAAIILGSYPLMSSPLQIREPGQAKTKRLAGPKPSTDAASVISLARKSDENTLKQGWLRGRFTAADTGKPVAGAVLELLIEGVPGKPNVAEALSDAQGRYEIQVPFGHCNLWGVCAPAGYFTEDPKTRGRFVTTPAEPEVIRDFVLKPGSSWQLELQGAIIQLDKLPLFTASPDVKQTASGDFGAVVLKPGRQLRGKVVDENGRPFHGAVVTNMTNYLLYSHLKCRTDAEGRFVMPDLSFGSQKLEAQFGDRFAMEERQFDANSGDFIITVRLKP